MGALIEWIHRDSLTPGYKDEFRWTPSEKLTGNQALRFESLKKNLLEHGLKHPLVVYDGHILIGNQRFEALKDHQEYFPCAVWEGGWSKPAAVVRATQMLYKQIDLGEVAIPSAPTQTGTCPGHVPAQDDVSSLKMPRLRALAKERGINTRGMKKEDIVEALRARDI